METQINNTLRTIFLVHMVISLVLGAALWLIPGRTLEMLGWVQDMVPLPDSDLSVPGGTFVDGVITRLLGAALVALGYSSYAGWRASSWERISLVVQLEFILCALGFVGTLAGFYLMERSVPLIGWVIAALLLIFTILWGWMLRR